MDETGWHPEQLFLDFGKSYICNKDEVHHQRVDDSRDGDDLVIEDERTASDGDGLSVKPKSNIKIVNIGRTINIVFIRNK